MKKIYGVLLMFLVLGCVDPFEIKDAETTDMLVVEGMITNQLRRHQIFLSRATPVSDRKLVREQGAVVTISDDRGNILSLTEEAPGIYETPEFSAQAGHTYTLRIATARGHEYTSREVRFKDGGDLGDVYAKYVDNNDEDLKGIQVYADTEDPLGKTRFYRWNYIETYEVKAPFPSIWVWTGGNNVAPREEKMDRCYAWDTLRNILIRHTKDLDEDRVTGQEIRFIPEYSHILRERYSILVQQFCLSEESYLYWENMKTISEDQGSLADQQPGSLPGNIIPVTNTDEIVLGYFEVCRMSERRLKFSAIDFYDEGLKHPQIFRSYCHEIEPIFVHNSVLGETMPRYERTMYIWDAINDMPHTIFELMPKSCCDCTDQGPTERPPFFE